MDYVENYFDNMDKRACGWINWMLAETYGGGYTIYLTGMRKSKEPPVRAPWDGNRFPEIAVPDFGESRLGAFRRASRCALQSH